MSEIKTIGFHPNCDIDNNIFRERSHIKALCHKSDDNIYAACSVYEDIVTEYPRDMLAGHLAFFGQSHSGRAQGQR